MSTPILTDIEVDDFVIIRAVAFANKIQRVMLRDVLSEHDMPVLEWRILFCIARFGDCHLTHIVERTSLDPAHGSRAAASLEERGMIRRTPDPADKRRKMLSMTPSGRAKFDDIWPQAQTMIKRITDMMDPEDFRQFKRLLDQVNDLASPLLEESLAARRPTKAA